MQYDLNLDEIAEREMAYPDGINVRLNGHGFRFPAELPAAALTPLLSKELDLMGLLGDLVRSQNGGSTWQMLELLFQRRDLPSNFLDALDAVFGELLGKEAFERFQSVKPSVPAYFRLTVGLAKLYGVELGKLFGLGASSESDGETSSPTSADSTTGSTPEVSGSVPDSPASSDSDA
ncbi:hypothetical protein [Streptomyces tirandamycinicus]|uniref:Tail assembly chaperone n=1 Tax=Streptomyces tirandamycinicus TaxID=2174846 RepID=A0A2S1T2E4_9ACTN|nr:hypothetical protein [Streptomyces tirandamycinicus]AWI32687.1 hypothetical protein DDW44_30695 [Streptomyces tirandamycinicus]